MVEYLLRTCEALHSISMWTHTHMQHTRSILLISRNLNYVFNIMLPVQ
jgi:hypothetical protein